MPADPVTSPPRRGAAFLRTVGPAGVASGVLLALVAWFVRRALVLNDGQWVYPIDDAYGHLAVAKHLVRDGLWSYSAANGFDSGISSLVWPLLLAGTFLVAGVNEYSTLVLNVLAAVASLFYAGRILQRFTRSGALVLGFLLAVIVAAPLPVLVLVGMEHCFHTLICLVFLDLACQRLARGEDGAAAAFRPGTVRWLLPGAAALLTASRYEGLFLVGVAGLLLLCRREWAFATVVGAAAAAPVVGFGLFSLSRGWPFLPCSVLLKGNAPTSLEPAALLAFLGRGHAQLLANWHVLFLVTALTVLLLVEFARRAGPAATAGATPWDYRTLFLGMTLATTGLHLQFAGLGWFYRYEAYLMVAGTVAVGVALAGRMPGPPGNVAWGRPAAWPCGAALVLAGLLFGGPAWRRARESLGSVAQASHNIYEQQFQMARFLRQHFQGRGVAANDVGCISYFADVRLFDTAGLVNLDVMRAKRAGRYDQDLVRRLLARYDVQVIVVYDYWAGEYGGQLPEWGVPIGRWTIPQNYVCAYDTVSFYAPRPELAPALTAALREFAPALPASVGQSGVYRGTRPPPVLGTHYPAFDEAGTFHWTSRAANFFLFPADERPRLPAGSTVELAVKPLSADQTLEVRVNGTPVQQRRFSAAERQTWVPLTIRAEWVPDGMNTLTLEGQGTTVIPPGDNRPILFGVREPRWQRPDDGPDPGNTGSPPR